MSVIHSAAVRINNLSKSYTIPGNRTKATNLGEAFLEYVRGDHRESADKTLWALQDVNLEIPRGEVLGIVGRNGAGKSTLLKILSRIAEPTFGRVELFGRVGSLLEVGTGFHPELTGRENVFLNGSILGMRRSEIRSQLDAIVDFAGVQKFLDLPVKRYSSGMHVRLAFSVAAHLTTEILIVDEVLAVGDANFQRKCLGKLKDVSGAGRTVIFVSHDTRALRRLCTTGLYLREGQVVCCDTIDEALERYGKDLLVKEIELPAASGPLSVKSFDVRQDDCPSSCLDGDSSIEVNIRFALSESVTLFRLGIYIKNCYGDVVTRSFHTDWDPCLENLRSGEFEMRLKVPPRLLMPGNYQFGLHASRYGIEGLISEKDLIRHVSVAAPESFNSEHSSEKWEAAIILDSPWRLMELSASP